MLQETIFLVIGFFACPLEYFNREAIHFQKLSRLIMTFYGSDCQKTPLLWYTTPHEWVFVKSTSNKNPKSKTRRALNLIKEKYLTLNR